MHGRKLVKIKMKKNVFFISCEEAKHICDKRQYDEASVWERVKLAVRLSWCRITRAYSKRNNKLTDVIKSSSVEVLKQDERQKLENAFKKELVKQSQ